MSGGLISTSLETYAKNWAAWPSVTIVRKWVLVRFR
jgi:hypothetical protein